MDVLDTLIRVIGVVATCATMAFGVAVYRGKIDQEAERRLAQIKIDTITMQAETITQLRIQKRVTEDTSHNERKTRKQCQRDLELALRTIRAYDNFVGRAWIESANGEILEAAQSGSGTSVPLDQRQLLARTQGGDPGTAADAGRTVTTRDGEAATPAGAADQPLPRGDAGPAESTEDGGADPRTGGSDVGGDPVKWKKKQERGQTLVEYGLLIALIAIIVIVALLFLGPVVSEIFFNTANALNDATP